MADLRDLGVGLTSSVLDSLPLQQPTAAELRHFAPRLSFLNNNNNNSSYAPSLYTTHKTATTPAASSYAITTTSNHAAAAEEHVYYANSSFAATSFCSASSCMGRRPYQRPSSCRAMSRGSKTNGPPLHYYHHDAAAAAAEGEEENRNAYSNAAASSFMCAVNGEGGHSTLHSHAPRARRHENQTQLLGQPRKFTAPRDIPAWEQEEQALKKTQMQHQQRTANALAYLDHNQTLVRFNYGGSGMQHTTQAYNLKELLTAAIEDDQISMIDALDLPVRRAHTQTARGRMQHGTEASRQQVRGQHTRPQSARYARRKKISSRSLHMTPYAPRGTIHRLPHSYSASGTKRKKPFWRRNELTLKQRRKLRQELQSLAVGGTALAPESDSFALIQVRLKGVPAGVSLCAVLLKNAQDVVGKYLRSLQQELPLEGDDDRKSEGYSVDCLGVAVATAQDVPLQQRSSDGSSGGGPSGQHASVSPTRVIDSDVLQNDVRNAVADVSQPVVMRDTLGGADQALEMKKTLHPLRNPPADQFRVPYEEGCGQILKFKVYDTYDSVIAVANINLDQLVVSTRERNVYRLCGVHGDELADAFISLHKEVFLKECQSLASRGDGRKDTVHVPLDNVLAASSEVARAMSIAKYRNRKQRELRACLPEHVPGAQYCIHANLHDHDGVSGSEASRPGRPGEGDRGRAVDGDAVLNDECTIGGTSSSRPLLSRMSAGPARKVQLRVSARGLPVDGWFVDSAALVVLSALDMGGEGGFTYVDQTERVKSGVPNISFGTLFDVNYLPGESDDQLFKLSIGNQKSLLGTVTLRMGKFLRASRKFSFQPLAFLVKDRNGSKVQNVRLIVQEYVDEVTRLRLTSNLVRVPVRITAKCRALPLDRHLSSEGATSTAGTHTRDKEEAAAGMRCEQATRPTPVIAMYSIAKPCGDVSFIAQSEPCVRDCVDPEWKSPLCTSYSPNTESSREQTLEFRVFESAPKGDSLPRTVATVRVKLGRLLEAGGKDVILPLSTHVSERIGMYASSFSSNSTICLRAVEYAPGLDGEDREESEDVNLQEVGHIPVKISLVMSATGLPHVWNDDYSRRNVRPNPVVGVFLRRPQSQRFYRHALSEPRQSTHTPKWETSFPLDLHGDDEIKLNVFHDAGNGKFGNRNRMGSVIVTVRDLLAVPQGKAYPLFHKQVAISKQLSACSSSICIRTKVIKDGDRGDRVEGISAIAMDTEGGGLKGGAEKVRREELTGSSGPAVVYKLYGDDFGQAVSVCPKSAGGMHVFKDDICTQCGIASGNEHIRKPDGYAPSFCKVTNREHVFRRGECRHCGVLAKRIDRLLTAKLNGAVSGGAFGFFEDEGDDSSGHDSQQRPNDAPAPASKGSVLPFPIRAMETVKVRIKVSCRDLIRMDRRDKSDPIVAILVRAVSSSRWNLLDRTEQVVNSHNPDFVNEFVVGATLDREFRLCVYDTDTSIAELMDHERMGWADMSLLDLCIGANSGRRRTFLLGHRDNHKQDAYLKQSRSRIQCECTIVRSALVIVDVQNDFLATNGTARVQGGEKIVPTINDLRQRCHFDVVSVVQDWHPADHISFLDTHRNNEKAKLYEPLRVPGMAVKQLMWPTHCLQGTHGAQVHPDVIVEESDYIVKKGVEKDIEAYSAFMNVNKKQKTSFERYLRKNFVSEVFVVGVGVECGVGQTALDAAALGFSSFVVRDCICSRDSNASGSMIAKLKRSNVKVVSTKRLFKTLPPRKKPVVPRGVGGHHVTSRLTIQVRCTDVFTGNGAQLSEPAGTRDAEDAKQNERMPDPLIALFVQNNTLGTYQFLDVSENQHGERNPSFRRQFSVCLDNNSTLHWVLFNESDDVFSSGNRGGGDVTFSSAVSRSVGTCVVHCATLHKSVLSAGGSHHCGLTHPSEDKKQALLVADTRIHFTTSLDRTTGVGGNGGAVVLPGVAGQDISDGAQYEDDFMHGDGTGLREGKHLQSKPRRHTARRKGRPVDLELTVNCSNLVFGRSLGEALDPTVCVLTESVKPTSRFQLVDQTEILKCTSNPMFERRLRFRVFDGGKVKFSVHGVSPSSMQPSKNNVIGFVSVRVRELLRTPDGIDLSLSLRHVDSQANAHLLESGAKIHISVRHCSYKDNADAVVGRSDDSTSIRGTGRYRREPVEDDDYGFDETFSHPSRPKKSSGAALIIVNVQNDYCTANGKAHVDAAEDLVPLINQIRRDVDFDCVVLSQDWHPEEHISFFSSHKRSSSARSEMPRIRQPFTLPSGKVVFLQPDHCLAGTDGAKICSGLRLRKGDIVIKTGSRVKVPCRSAFSDDGRKCKTKLGDVLKEHSIRSVCVVGVAYDYAVGYTALDAKAAGYRTFVVEDAVRGMSPDSTRGMVSKLRRSRVTITRSADLFRLVGGGYDRNRRTSRTRDDALGGTRKIHDTDEDSDDEFVDGGIEILGEGDTRNDARSREVRRRDQSRLDRIEWDVETQTVGQQRVKVSSHNNRSVKPFRDTDRPGTAGSSRSKGPAERQGGRASVTPASSKRRIEIHTLSDGGSRPNTAGSQGRPMTGRSRASAGTTSSSTYSDIMDPRRVKASVKLPKYLTLRVHVRCSNLPKFNVFVKTSPAIAVFEKDSVTGHLRLVASTEVLKGNHNPRFQTQLECHGGPNTQLQFVLYNGGRGAAALRHNDRDAIGIVTVLIRDLFVGDSGGNGEASPRLTQFRISHPDKLIRDMLTERTAVMHFSSLFVNRERVKQNDAGALVRRTEGGGINGSIKPNHAENTRSDDDRRFAFIFVDVQNDFCGKKNVIGLAAKEGTQLVKRLNDLRDIEGDLMFVLTKDWHAERHTSFYSMHMNRPGAALWSSIQLPDGKEQLLWPKHCVQQTTGATLHPDLLVRESDVIITKGTRADTECYSGFADFCGRKTNLEHRLREAGVTDVFVAGVGYGFGVGHTALDAVRAGFKVAIIEDAVSTVQQKASEAMIFRLRKSCVTFLTSSQAAEQVQRKK